MVGCLPKGNVDDFTEGFCAPDPRAAVHPVLALFSEQDRELYGLYASGHASCRSLGAALNRSTSFVSRRIAQLRRRMADGTNMTIARFGHELPVLYRAVAVAAIVQREPQRTLARRFGLTYDELKLILADVRGWAKVRRHSSRTEGE